MPDSNSNQVQVEGIQFYKRSNIADIFRIVVITLVVFVCLAILILWFAIDSGARRAYKEARDVRKALRAVGTEYYGEASSHSPSATGKSHCMNGMLRRMVL